LLTPVINDWIRPRRWTCLAGSQEGYRCLEEAQPPTCALFLSSSSLSKSGSRRLGLHLSGCSQVSLPEIDGAIEPIIFAGREGATGRSVPLADRVNLLGSRFEVGQLALQAQV
jgi:cobalamin biosynthesis Mg chelatase CobN